MLYLYKQGYRNFLFFVNLSNIVEKTKENFLNAMQIVDKFHVKQILLKAMDDVRKGEQKKTVDKKTLFSYRKLFMVPERKMTDAQKDRLASLSQSYPKTGRAFRIVQALDEFYAAESRDEGERLFSQLYSWMRRCRLEPMKETASTLMNHKEEILNYFTNRLTNAISEGINSMIQAAKRKARGYHTFEGFASMIYLVAGKLKLSVPCPL
jgi:transposase